MDTRGRCPSNFEGWILKIQKKWNVQRYQSGQLTVFSGAYTITVLQYVYTWLILQLRGRSGPTASLLDPARALSRRSTEVGPALSVALAHS